METPINWIVKPFSALSGAEVYDLLQLRAAIFVVEQDCVYLDPDDKDREAWHCLHYRDGELLAAQRCIAPGVSYEDDSSIGRIVVDKRARGTGLSQEMLKLGIAFNRETWPGHGIQIGAQAHLQKFYGDLGFAVCSDLYLEDGIDHVHMRLAA